MIVKRKLSKSSYVILFILLAICMFSAVRVYSIYGAYQYGKEVYKEINELAVTPPSASDEIQESTGDKDSTLPSYAQYSIDFHTLLDINPEIIGWIRFDAPEVINYPIIGGENSENYLRTNIYGEYNIAGSIFTANNNATDFSDKNTIIYGHNMNNGTMFGELSSYLSSAFCEEYPYFYIYTPDNMATKYQIFSVEQIEATDFARYKSAFEDEDSFLSYMENAMAHSIYTIDVSIDASMPIVTLSTCTSADDKRLIVQGIKIDSEERPKASE